MVLITKNHTDRGWLTWETKGENERFVVAPMKFEIMDVFQVNVLCLDAFWCYEACQHEYPVHCEMNRIRCTKFLLLVIFVSLFAYLMLKDESVCITVNSVHNAMTAREIATLLQGGQYLHHSKFENNNLCQGFSFLFSFSFFFFN